MSDANTKTTLIFFLLLDESLPHSYFVFDRVLKEVGLTLIPVTNDQLQILKSYSSQDNVFVICSTTGSKEFKTFNTKIRELLKFLLQSEKFIFIKMSSFCALNDEKKFAMLKNYFFINYPVDAKKVAAWISHSIRIKSEVNNEWPGGKKANPGVLSV
jgi:hypothetical protein